MRKNNILCMIHIILLSYLFSYIFIIKKDSEYYNGVGLCFGVAFGAAFDNIGLGICLDLVFGVAMEKRNSNTQGSPLKK